MSFTDYLSSDYIQSLRKFGLDYQRTPVSVYVEGDVDQHFWEQVLLPFSSKYRFTVSVYHVKNENREQSEKKGKSQLLTLKKLGKSRIACVDADYDLLINTVNSESVRTNKFVFNTIYYSVENILCHPILLSNLFEKLTDSENKFDWEHYLTQLSHELVDVLYYWLVRYENEPELDFSIIVNPLACFHAGATNYESSMTKIESNFKNCFPDWQERLNGASMCKKKIENLGITKDTIYQLFRGHTFFNVFIKDRMCCLVREKQSEEISKLFNTLSPEEKIEKNIELKKNKSNISDMVEQAFYANLDGLSGVLPSVLMERLSGMYGDK